MRIGFAKKKRSKKRLRNFCVAQIKIYGQRLQCRSRVLNVPGQESFVDPKGDPGSHSTVPCIPKKEKRKEKGRRGGSEGRE